MALLVAINQGHCDSTVHSKRILVMPITRNCTSVYKYEQSLKLRLDDKEAMWRVNWNCERWVNFQVLSWYVLGVSNRHTRVTATTPTKLEKQTSRHCKFMSTELWAWSPEQKWQLASGAHCSGTAVADPPSDPATNDIPTGAFSNSQLIQTGYIIHKLMSFIHHCCCKGKQAINAQRGSRCIALLFI